MPAVKEFHRPTTIDEALALLANGGTAMGGGTKLNVNHNPFDPAPEPIVAVELRQLNLDTIGTTEGRVRLGATATLQAVADHADVPIDVRAAAERSAPRTTRNGATIGGTIATRNPESELLAALLVRDAVVELAGDATSMPLGDWLANPSGLIVAVSIDPSGVGVAHRVGRTPSDVPIVAVCGRRDGDNVTYAASGVAATPVVITADAIGALEPIADFRGSAAYRRHLATVLLTRVTEELSS